MSFLGDFLKAGITVAEDKLTFNKDVEFSGNVVMQPPTELEISYTDNEDGTASVTVEGAAMDGTAFERALMIHLWTSDTELGSVSAITGITVDTGTELTTITSNGEMLIVSDATGTIELTLDNGGAGSFFLNADFGGFIFSEEITVTA